MSVVGGLCHHIVVSCSWMNAWLKPRHSLNRSRSKSKGEIGPFPVLTVETGAPRVLYTRSTSWLSDSSNFNLCDPQISRLTGRSALSPERGGLVRTK